MSGDFAATEQIAPISATGRTEVSSGPYGTVETVTTGKRVLYPTAAQWLDVASQLLVDGWNMCLDITAVDYKVYEADRRLPAGIEPARFEVVATFISHSRRERIQARVQVPDADPALASIYSVYPGTDYAEREIYDLFGIEFDGHPDLSRILMPETWQGHPLRKDYAIGEIPVQFKAPAASGNKGATESESEPT